MRTAALLLCGTMAANAAGFAPVDERGYARLLERHRGKTVLVNFWATWCEPCRAELPALARLAAGLRAKGVILLTISADEPEQARAALVVLRKSGVAGRAWIKRAASDGAFIDSVDPAWSGALPATFLYDRRGARAARFVGEAAIADIEAAVRRLL